MKQYRITVTEIGGNDGSVVGNETTTTDIFTQVVAEADFNLRGVISAVNSKPRTRNRKQTLVAPKVAQ
jgi:hypothetical protein